MEKLKNLLLQISIIQKKYDDLAEYSGEHYNVFDILGVRSDELSHSAILTNLLNAKGRHGQKDLFLDLFIETVKDLFEDDEKKASLINFNKSKSKAVKELYAGRVNINSEQGGRIDIVINDGKNNIIIENKIYACDQPKQIIRYHEYDKTAPILYLTLYGKEPDYNSKGENLINGTHFICISYQNEIIIWLEKCIKEMVNKPIIRETLNQYLFLIKSLTNNSNNNNMKNELLNSILQNNSNFSSAVEIIRLHESDDLKLMMVNEIVNKIEIRLKSEGFEIISKLKELHSKNKYGELISFDNTIINENNLCIRLNFEDNLFSNLIIGFYNTKEKKYIPELFSNYKNVFGKALETENYPSYIKYTEYRDWHYEQLGYIYYNYEEFENDFMIKINQHLEVFKKTKIF